MNKLEGVLKVLSLLYPPFLVLLVLSPTIVGFLVDYELSDSFSMLINLMWMLVITIPYCIFQKKIIYRIGLIVYFIIGFVEIGHWITMKGPLSIISLLIISNTNYEEAVSFLNMKSTWGYITLIVYTLIFILAFRISPKRIRVKNRLVHIGAVVIIFGLIVFSLRNSIPKYRFLPQSVKISYAFVNELRDYKRASDENKLQVVDAVLDKPPNQKHTFVLILGETCSRNHMSLYGADINTNPKLSKRKDIIKFTDVISGYNYTIQSVPAMLSQTNLENKLGIAESIDILDTFHSAGFKTFWISNQSPIGIWDNVISGIARKSDHTEFVNTSSNSSQEAILSRAYDENLFKPFKSALEEDENSKFIVLHLMGSHNTYSKRYPPSFEHFKGKSSRKEEVIAEYRNSIRYNDFVVDSLLTILDFYTLSEGNEVSSAIYVSDHGENVFDEMDGLGHDYAKELPRAVVEIPFLVWLSPGYREKNTGKVNSILENKDKPYVTDDLFHSMIDISNIKTPLLDSTKSVFNQHFDHKRRRVLVDGKDYDRESETVLKERKLGKKKAL
tara:strand:+ start:16736 stop:18406 length:1671 start_codon:yes stop_codon:yes gene_type:complete